jgi:hypothetical protein
MGFVDCDDGECVDDVERIAVFVDGDRDFSHVARQLADGWWSSKLGFFEDLSHRALEDLLDGRPRPYGSSICFMQRPRTQASHERSGLVLPRR